MIRCFFVVVVAVSVENQKMVIVADFDEFITLSEMRLLNLQNTVLSELHYQVVYAVFKI